MSVEQERIEIDIPARLNTTVENTLRQVNAIHRRRVISRVGTTLGSLVAVFGAFLLVCFTNPALASQIPLIGDHFKRVNTGAKVYGTTNMESYDGFVQEVDKAMESDGGPYEVWVTKAACDGYSIQLSLQMALPESAGDKYDWVDVGLGKSAWVFVDGQEPALAQMNSFRPIEGVWASTMNIELPEDLQRKESYQLDMTLENMVLNSNEPENDLRPIHGTFTASFTVEADLESFWEFTCEAEDNGAKVLGVSGTPMRTVISVEKPYWGPEYEDFPLGQDNAAKGRPHLYDGNGQEISINYNVTRDMMGYDAYADETQWVDLVFDSVPAGAEKVTLQFENGDVEKEVLAAFEIDLKNQTVKAK